MRSAGTRVCDIHGIGYRRDVPLGHGPGPQSQIKKNLAGKDMDIMHI